MPPRGYRKPQTLTEADCDAAILSLQAIRLLAEPIVDRTKEASAHAPLVLTMLDMSVRELSEKRDALVKSTEVA